MSSQIKVLLVMVKLCSVFLGVRGETVPGSTMQSQSLKLFEVSKLCQFFPRLTKISPLLIYDPEDAEILKQREAQVSLTSLNATCSGAEHSHFLTGRTTTA